MIKNFFQSLDRYGVEYLLISGQAAVLYGAAAFSEDIDIWVNPTEPSRQGLLSALKDSTAAYYKLTPGLTMEHLAGGHGFHFLIPGESADEVFLDIMGKPPRAASFAKALLESNRMETDWGNLRVIGIRQLVEIKKTQRLEDYAVISRLALAGLSESQSRSDSLDLSWAVQNIFSLSTLEVFFRDHCKPEQITSLNVADSVVNFGRQMSEVGGADETTERLVAEWIQERMMALQQNDRSYWRAIISELKVLRASGKLMTEGAPVR